jgi:putative FmdB family regulatory protein
MIYPYRCKSCSTEFEIIKAVADLDREETCPKCSCIGERYIAQTHFYGASDWQGERYNPGLGCVVKSNKHIKEICKQRGLEEVGNTSPETLHKMEDTARAEKIKRHQTEARDKAVAWMNN